MEARPEGTDCELARSLATYGFYHRPGSSDRHPSGQQTASPLRAYIAKTWLTIRRHDAGDSIRSRVDRRERAGRHPLDAPAASVARDGWPPARLSVLPRGAQPGFAYGRDRLAGAKPAVGSGVRWPSSARPRRCRVRTPTPQAA